MLNGCHVLMFVIFLNRINMTKDVDISLLYCKYFRLTSADFLTEHPTLSLKFLNHMSSRL